MENRLITVAIHTYERALELKAYLESEGIAVTLQNINLTSPVVSSGIRVRINETDLPKALRLIENVEIFTAHTNPPQSVSNNKVIIVPVDFSEISDKACRLAFTIADDKNAEVVVLHSFVDPGISTTIQLSDNLDFDMAETEILETIAKDAETRMAEMSEVLRNKIKEGELPPVKFSRKITEGLPEEAINEYAKQVSPYLIVMGTRGVEKKERELVGSITAEVLDTCRFPVLTVSDAIDFDSLDSVKHILMFCSLDQADLIAIDSLSRLFSDRSIPVTLAVINHKKQFDSDSPPATALIGYCKENYPKFDFSMRFFSVQEISEGFNELLREHEGTLIAVPNKKKNVFARFFNPGLAHRLLFRTNNPMLVLPV